MEVSSFKIYFEGFLRFLHLDSCVGIYSALATLFIIISLSLLLKWIQVAYKIIIGKVFTIISWSFGYALFFSFMMSFWAMVFLILSLYGNFFDLIDGYFGIIGFVDKLDNLHSEYFWKIVALFVFLFVVFIAISKWLETKESRSILFERTSIQVLSTLIFIILSPIILEALSFISIYLLVVINAGIIIYSIVFLAKTISSFFKNIDKDKTIRVWFSNRIVSIRKTDIVALSSFIFGSTGAIILHLMNVGLVCNQS